MISIILILTKLNRQLSEMNTDKYQISFNAKAGYLPALDGMRAVSILIVILAHAGLSKIFPGAAGVTIFFFISGFLITRLLLAELEENNNLDLPRFYIRRLLRLMPALYVFITIISLANLPYNGSPNKYEITSAYLYYVNYYNALSPIFNWPITEVPWWLLWSLAVEEHFYLIFPFLLLVFGKTHKSRIILVVTIIILSLISRLIAYHILNLGYDYTYTASECRIENIAWGCLLAIMFDKKPNENSMLEKFVGWHWVIIAALSFIIAFAIKDDSFRSTWRYSIHGITLFILVVNLYMFKKISFAIDIFELAPMRYIGRLSYSLYLWHWPIVWIARRMEGLEDNNVGTLSFISMIIVLILSLAAAYLSYNFVEKPFLNLRKYFGAKPVEILK